MNDKIKELKDLLFELDSKHSVSVPDTQQNINDATKRIVKLFAIPFVVFSEAELKAKLEQQLEETRQWLIGEDFEGLAERL